MKHDQLCAIAHNLADSMASGLGFMIGYYPMNIFGEATESEGGVIFVDFLAGNILNGDASDALRRAAKLYSEALPGFCGQHGVNVDDFLELSASFTGLHPQQRVTIHVTDRNGHRSTTEYGGVPLRRLKTLDPIGRVRRMPRKRASA